MEAAQIADLNTGCCQQCCKKSDLDFPSPFRLPTLIKNEFLSQRRNSLYDFIKSRNTFEADERSKWDTNGRTSVQRFNQIYDDWCEKEERRKVSVEHSKQVLAKLGIGIRSELEQCILYCRFKTKAEIRREKRTINLKNTAMQKRFKEQYFDPATLLHRNKPLGTARFLIGELAYQHFIENRVVVTGDEHDFVCFDDLAQKFTSYFASSIMINKGIKPETVKKGNGMRKKKKEKSTSKENPVENPLLLPLYFARDVVFDAAGNKISGNFGPDSLSRCDVYLLNNVEVLTMKQLKHRQKQEFINPHPPPTELMPTKWGHLWWYVFKYKQILFHKFTRFRYYLLCFYESIIYVSCDCCFSHCVCILDSSS